MCQVVLSDPDRLESLALIMASISEITACMCISSCGVGSEAELNVVSRMRIR